MNYKDQIKSPKWQRRRLEILSRDNFTCQVCGAKEETLHVHHICYLKEKEIWDYPDNLLITLCESCHETEHKFKDEWIKNAIMKINTLGFMHVEICAMLYALHFELDSGLKSPEDIFGDVFSYATGIMRIWEWRDSLKK